METQAQGLRRPPWAQWARERQVLLLTPGGSTVWLASFSCPLPLTPPVPTWAERSLKGIGQAWGLCKLPGAKWAGGNTKHMPPPHPPTFEGPSYSLLTSWRQALRVLLVTPQPHQSCLACIFPPLFAPVHILPDCLVVSPICLVVRGSPTSIL